MLTKYLKILLICCISNYANGQLVETQYWRYTAGDIVSDTTLYVRQDSVFIPLVQYTYAKLQFYRLLNEYDSLQRLIDMDLVSSGHESPNPRMVADGRLFICVDQYKIKGLFLEKEMWRISTGQTKDYNEHAGTYEIFYVEDVGVVAVVAKDYSINGVFEKRSYTLLHSWSNISHYKVSPYLLKRARKKIAELNPSMIE